MPTDRIETGLKAMDELDRKITELKELHKGGHRELERLQVLCEPTNRLGAILKKLDLLINFRTKPDIDETRILDLD